MSQKPRSGRYEARKTGERTREGLPVWGVFDNLKSQFRSFRFFKEKGANDYAMILNREEDIRTTTWSPRVRGPRRDPDSKRKIRQLEMQLRHVLSTDMTKAPPVIKKLIRAFKDDEDTANVIRYQEVLRNIEDALEENLQIYAQRLREKAPPSSEKKRRIPHARETSHRARLHRPRRLVIGHVEDRNGKHEQYVISFQHNRVNSPLHSKTTENAVLRPFWTRNDLSLVRLPFGGPGHIVLLQAQSWGTRVVKRFDSEEIAMNYLRITYGAGLKANDPSRLRARKKRR